MMMKKASSGQQNSRPSSDSKRESIRIPFEGVFERIVDRIKNQWLLFGIVVVLVLALLALQGSQLLSADLRFVVKAILLVVGVIGLGYFVGGAWLASKSKRPETKHVSDSTLQPPVSEGIAREAVRRPWVAVMDLKNQGGREKDEPQCFGVSSFLRRVLETVPSDKYKFGVVPLSELMGIKGDQLSKNEIRRKTGARFVLEGRLDLRADPCVVEVRLSITSGEDSVLWERTYVDPWANIQSTIKKIAGNVVEEVLTRTRKPDDPGFSDSVAEIFDIIGEISEQPIDVFEAFNQGIFYQNRFNNLRKGRDFRDGEFYLKKAANMAETAFHDALAQLAFLYILRWETNSDMKLLAESEVIWRQILKTKPQDPFALAELGYVSYVAGSQDGAGAVRLARKAVASDPEHAIAHNVLALLYLYLGFYESNITIEENEVFPLAPSYIYPYTNAALAQQLRGSYQEALELALKAKEIEREAFVANLLAGAQYFYLGDLRKAEQMWSEGRRCCQEAVAPILDVVGAWIPAREGDLSSAKETLQANSNAPWLRGPYGPYYISLCAIAGDDDKALVLLEDEPTFARSYRYLISEPTLETLRENSGFQSLLEQRYQEWEKNLDDLESGLPNPIDRRLVTPQEFIKQ
ncbi:MAG: tetratricopeptide repeat protein [Desulfobacterales bacterium]|jgi:TolB-like protein